MPNINIGSIFLGDHDHDWFIAMSRLGDQGSIRGNLSSVVGFYVRRNKASYVEMLHYNAAKYGLSPQEAFHRLVHNILPLSEPLKEPLQDVKEVPGLSDAVNDEVPVNVPWEVYELLRSRAEQEGVTLQELLKSRFLI